MSDGSATPQTLIYGQTGKVECISFDWESDNIYMVDSETPKIEILTLVRRFRRTIVNNTASNPDQLENPRALDVVPSHGYVRPKS